MKFPKTPPKVERVAITKREWDTVDIQYILIGLKKGFVVFYFWNGHDDMWNRVVQETNHKELL